MQVGTRQRVRDSQGEIWQVSFFVAIILTYGYVRIWRCPLSDSLAALKQQRSRILTQILELGDFRSGSITAINGRCGKPSCHCHQPNQPAHAPAADTLSPEEKKRRRLSSKTSRAK